MAFVYLLESVDEKKTYVGATVDVKRRLRQHNGELKGGAKYTSGGMWRLVCYVKNFPCWVDALQFEWMWKFWTRKTPKGKPLQRRLEALNLMLASGRSTKASIPFSMWNPEVVDNEISKQLQNDGRLQQPPSTIE